MADLLLRVGSPLDDYIFGDHTDNQIDGGLGNDRMTGGQGNDTYLYTAGDGRDIIRDGATSGADQLLIAGYLSTRTSASPGSGPTAMTLPSGSPAPATRSSSPTGCAAGAASRRSVSKTT
jgi:Ca2+-binding RTX toxin-like protein